MNRLSFVMFVSVVLFGAACGDDDATGTDAGSRSDSGRVDAGRTDGGRPGDGGGMDEDAGDTDEDAGMMGTDAGTDSGTAPTEPPVITRIAWMTSRPCSAGSSSTFTITLDVTDADTAAGMLTYMGSVGGCTGMLNANPAMITCPNLAPYMGNVTVRDPEGNMDMEAFMFGPCSDGEVMP
jgi:hypothetical protein